MHPHGSIGGQRGEQFSVHAQVDGSVPVVGPNAVFGRVGVRERRLEGISRGVQVLGRALDGVAATEAEHEQESETNDDTHRGVMGENSDEG